MYLVTQILLFVTPCGTPRTYSGLFHKAETTPRCRETNEHTHWGENMSQDLDILDYILGCGTLAPGTAVEEAGSRQQLLQKRKAKDFTHAR